MPPLLPVETGSKPRIFQPARPQHSLEGAQIISLTNVTGADGPPVKLTTIARQAGLAPYAPTRLPRLFDSKRICDLQLVICSQPEASCLWDAPAVRGAAFQLHICSAAHLQSWPSAATSSWLSCCRRWVRGPPSSRLTREPAIPLLFRHDTLAAYFTETGPHAPPAFERDAI